MAGGFRRRVQETLPEQYAEATRLHLLLDDFPVATLVSGVAFGEVPMGGEGPVRLPQTDLCSGWRSDGTVMLQINRDRIVPAVTGPDAPDLTPARSTPPDEPPGPELAPARPGPATSDDLGWHERDALSPLALRRARRLDVWEADGVLQVDSLYRDSHVDVDGRETVIHEYTLRGSVDPHDFRIVDVVATPRVLPWVECPSAAASAQRLTGQNVRDLRPVVRREFTGISTCTHLNDQMRQLADVPALVWFSAVR
ncbi:DUF2889 domain-containing protein [Cryptosporangium sp. NPDC048952]|uniref:DUF2889 domain-containing protein n=1 Tax=Cryptosporangium sp. NPDC048952 TaxID=3363961 RepID=UPI00370FAFD6